MVYFYLLVPVLILLAAGTKIIRPNQRGIIERRGKYLNFLKPGFHWIVPFVDKLYPVNVSEQKIKAEALEIMTKDDFIATVDAQVYFKIKSDEESVKTSNYNVNYYKWQIVNIVEHTLLNSIGPLTIDSVYNQRVQINNNIYQALHANTQGWGIEILRTELMEIDQMQYL